MVLASEFYDMPNWVERVLSSFNVTFMILFTFEMVLKMIGYGYKDYFNDAFNFFDCFIVIMSYVDLLTIMEVVVVVALRDEP